jgi:hypothetical protein
MLRLWPHDWPKHVAVILYINYFQYSLYAFFGIAIVHFRIMQELWIRNNLYSPCG